jgi:hypothetical protein
LPPPYELVDMFLSKKKIDNIHASMIKAKEAHYVNSLIDQYIYSKYSQNRGGGRF